MKHLIVLLIALTLAPATHAEQNFELTKKQASTARSLMTAAQSSELAWDIVESLTTEIGPRPAGTEAEARARNWGESLGKKLGFDRVVVESFSMPRWDRGELSIRMMAPYEQTLYGTALGGSGASSNQKAAVAEMVYFRSFHDIKTVKAGELAGKIAFIDGDRMVPSQTGAGYGPANEKRRVGWQHAQRGGALGLVVRSVGSDSHRFPHTGMMSAKDGGEWASIPVVAVSNPDADQLRRLHEAGKAIKLSVRSTAQWRDEVTSGNVVMDLIGREKPDEIVLIGAHLDSWDLGTGAVDDGAGVAITTAAAALIAQLPQRPRRTIRVVMFGAEEVGLLGARAYASQHEDQIASHVLASESDFGADSIWQLSSNVDASANSAIDAIGRLITPLGIVRGGSEVPGGGPDIVPLALQGVPTIRLNQNGMDYFDLHHTPDDTLDKIDPQALAQNVAAWAAFVYLAAELDVEFRPGKN